MRFGFALAVLIACGGTSPGEAASNLQATTNLWPNADSEADPPQGTVVLNDGSSPTWDYRVTVPDAADGVWARELDATAGNTGNGPGTTDLIFGLKVAAQPGDRFNFTAVTRIISGAVWSAGVSVLYFDAAGTQLLAGGIDMRAIGPIPGWTVVDIARPYGQKLSAPAGTAYAIAALRVSKFCRAQFDSIVLVKNP